jgi:hypothetical protein
VVTITRAEGVLALFPQVSHCKSFHVGNRRAS